MPTVTIVALANITKMGMRTGDIDIMLVVSQLEA